MFDVHLIRYPWSSINQPLSIAFCYKPSLFDQAWQHRLRPSMSYHLTRKPHPIMLLRRPVKNLTRYKILFLSNEMPRHFSPPGVREKNSSSALFSTIATVKIYV